MAERCSARRLYLFTLGLCILGTVSLLIEWRRITRPTVKGARSQAEPSDRSPPAIQFDIRASAQNQTPTRPTGDDLPVLNGSDATALWRAEQGRRQATLRRACQSLDNLGERRNIFQLIRSRKGRFYYFVVDDTHRLVYTWIAKVASTNWMSAFLVLKGRYKRVEDVPLKKIGKSKLVKLSYLSEEGISRRLANYTNFIFVRHPFTRLLSAYRNKLLERNSYYPRQIGAAIIRRYRQNATEEELRTGYNVTFGEFVRYLVDTRDGKLNHHWRPMYKMVLPCSLRFDYIGKLETGEEDADHILRETKVDHLIHFKPRPPAKPSKTNLRSILDRHYSQVPSADLIRLYAKFKPDFQLFGYEVPDSMKSTLLGSSVVSAK